MNRRHLGVTSHPQANVEITRTGDDTPMTPGHSRLVIERSAAGVTRQAAHVPAVQRRPLWRALLVALAVGAVACGSPELASVERSGESRESGQVAAGDPAGQPNDTAAEGVADTGPVDPGGKAAVVPDSAQPAKDSGATGSQSQHQAAAPIQPDDAAEARRQAEQSKPDMDDVDVTGALDPDCVRPGGKVTITIATEPDASVAYNAFYSDGQSGAAEPFGANYGGNAGGLTGAEGRYQDTWTVAANAPSGPGHVEIVAAANGGFGKTTIPFAVADAITGTCDQ